MRRIDQLIEDLCPDGVKYEPISKVGTFIRGGGPQKKDFTDVGVGCIHYGQIYTHYGISAVRTKVFVSDDVALKSRKANPGDVIIAVTSENDEDLGKSVAWLGEAPVAVSNHTLIFTTELEPRFISYFLSSSSFHRQKQRFITGTKVKALPENAFGKIFIPVPPLPVQQEIVRILDMFTQLEAELEAELEARRAQYEYYRSLLLSYGEDCEWTTLGESFGLKAGKFIKSAEITSQATTDRHIPCFGGNGVRGFVESYSHSGQFPLIGRQGALCGNVNWADGDFYATEHAIVAEPNETVDARWAYHMLGFLNLNQYATKSAQPGLSVTRLKDVPFPLPELTVQTETADILDKFDAVINDFNSGLPAEIEARRKQYEYYRDKLLTFKELTA
ncbi:restriction endonuclease subunit S [Corynebacteriaceae bacterium 6-324]